MMKRTVGTTLAAVAVMGLAAPAAAGDRRPGRGHHHHRKDDKVTAGDVVAGAVVIGVLAALLGKKKAAPAPVAADYVPPAVPMPIVALSEEDASNACGDAAESEGARLARNARVMGVTAVDPAGEGWIVQGRLQLRDSYRGAGGSVRGFRCTVGATGMPSVHFDDDGTTVVAVH